MTPTQAQIEQFTKETVVEFSRFCREAFNLPSGWLPKLKMSFAVGRLGSKAGVRDGLPIISLALRRYLTPVDGLLEYKSYSANPLIGSFISDDWQTCIRGLVAHEISHCVQFHYVVNGQANSYVEGLGVVESGHGSFFRRIYKQLRVGLVNHAIATENRGIPPKTTVAPDAVRRGTPTTNHIFVGQEFTHVRLGKCAVTGYRPLGKKYKFIFKVIATGKMFKTSHERLVECGCV
jgi:hypothetical protein